MVEITARSAETFLRVLQALVINAHETNVWEIPIRTPEGVQVATLNLHNLPVRPKDMPRAHRPKRRLSKRQRVAAKCAKAAK